jgi:hypothetical protein
VSVVTERAAVVDGGAVRTAASAASVLDAGGGACAVAGAVTTDKEVLISTCNAVFTNCSGIASIHLRREEESPTFLVDVMTQISPEILVQALLRLY